MPFSHRPAVESFHLHFVGVGPQRTGTTWLRQFLQHHPAICLPKGLIEPMFFDLYYEQGLSRYVTHFARQNKDQLCGEVSTTYFDAAVVPARIHQLNPGCKIIINLRKPISRALSLYRHHLNKGRVRGSFQEAALQMPHLIDSGRYARHIPRWLDTFGPKQVAFVLLDDIKITPENVLSHIYRFLEIAQIEMPESGHKKVNAFSRPRFPALARFTARLVARLQAGNFYQIIEFGKKLGLKKFVYSGGKQDTPGLTKSDQLRLLEMYEADIAFVENLLKRDLPTWRQITD